ncbi:MAG: flagellar basal body L-ring protein FlgH [Limnobacter sp.]|nr:flagellar basal body L-ring protein FlgH [Limnobacter sp.]
MSTEAQAYPIAPVDVALAAPMSPDAQVASTASLYSTSTFRPLFEDDRARFVGDTSPYRFRKTFRQTKATM